MSLDDVRAILPEGTMEAIRLYSGLAYPIRPEPIAPRRPSGDPRSPGIGNNHDSLGDAVLYLLYRDEVTGGSLRAGESVVYETIRNEAQWLIGAMTKGQMDHGHCQREPSLAYAALLQDDPMLRGEFLQDGFVRYYDGIKGDPLLKSRAGMTLRPWLRFTGDALRAARIMRALVSERFWVLSPASLPPDALEEKVLVSLEAWCLDRGELGKTAEEGRGWTRDISSPWRPTLPEGERATWPYLSFGDPYSIASNDQPFMMNAIPGHEMLWADAYGVPLSHAIRARFRELSTWALYFTWDPETGRFMEALERGSFGPGLLERFSSWDLSARELEGTTFHSHAGLIAMANAPRLTRARLLDRLLLRLPEGMPHWIISGELDAQTLFSVARLKGDHATLADELHAVELS